MGLHVYEPRQLEFYGVSILISHFELFLIHTCGMQPITKATTDTMDYFDQIFLILRPKTFVNRVIIICHLFLTQTEHEIMQAMFLLSHDETFRHDDETYIHFCLLVSFGCIIVCFS